MSVISTRVQSLVISLSLTVLFIVPSSPAQVTRELGTESFDSAMTAAGMLAEDIGFDQLEMNMWQGDQWRLDFFTLLHTKPLSVPRHSELIKSQCAENLSTPVRFVQQAGRLQGHPVRRGLIDNPIAKYLNHPDSAQKKSFANSRNLLIGSELRTTRQGVDLLMRMIEDKEFKLRQALDGVDKKKYRRLLIEYFRNPDKDTNNTDRLIEELADTIDYNLLLAATQDLVVACQYVVDSFLGGEFPSFRTEIQSRQGMVYVGTNKDDIHEFVEAPLLIIDGGGNDRYGFIGQNSEFPLSIIIDKSGDDIYRSIDTATSGIGGAVCAVSIVMDLDGNDRYEGKDICQGAAIFGAAILYDRRGDDVYRAEMLTQGAGMFGVGLLIDSAGNDSLYSHQQSQGFGYTQGVGMLVNGSGDDIYIAEDSIPLERSSQSKDHNVTMAQGAGYGRRADYIDGHSWAGGVGILADLSGDDSYSCGVFGQGVGYWYAVGMLLDAQGSDRYKGVWYVQGAAAHFAVGVLNDASGNDTYDASMNMAHVAGHDFSLGWLIEWQGDDTYRSPNLSLGAGNDNGIGICWEFGGNDSYTSVTDVSLGASRGASIGLRSSLATMGIFIDEAGTDQYNGKTPAKNRSRWLGSSKDSKTTSPYIGVGLDKE